MLHSFPNDKLLFFYTLIGADLKVTCMKPYNPISWIKEGWRAVRATLKEGLGLTGGSKGSLINVEVL